MEPPRMPSDASAAEASRIRILFLVLIVALISSCALMAILGTGFWQFDWMNRGLNDGDWSHHPYVHSMTDVTLRRDWGSGDWEHPYHMLTADGRDIPVGTNVTDWYIAGREMFAVPQDSFGKVIRPGDIPGYADLMEWEHADVYWNDDGYLFVNLRLTPYTLGKIMPELSGLRVLRDILINLTLISLGVFLFFYLRIRRRWLETDRELAIAVEQHRMNRDGTMVRCEECPRCGAPRVEDSRFCAYCGENLIVLDSEESTDLLRKTMREGGDVR